MHAWYPLISKNSFNLCLKEYKEEQLVICEGRSFQYLGPVNIIIFFAKIVRVRGR